MSIFRRYLCLIGPIVAGLQGQTAFQNLASNGDGSVLYFSSPLRLKGSTEQYPHPKIFVWDATSGSVQLFEQRPPSITLAGPQSSSLTAYRLIATSVSSDGNTLAITALSDCSFGTPCRESIARYSAELHQAGFEPATFPGRASLSPNGRFLLLGSALFAPFLPPPMTLRDLSTGGEASVNNVLQPPYRHQVSDDGTIVVYDSAKFQLWRNGARHDLEIQTHAAGFKIDRAARRVFYWSNDGVQVRLVVLDVPTGVRQDLNVFTTDSAPQTFDISDDGTVVAYIERGQAWIVRTPERRPFKVTNASDAIVEIALSGDGRKMFAVTQAARILRIDLQSLVTDEIVPATPTGYVNFPYAGAAILAVGGAYDFSGLNIPALSTIRLLQREQYLLAPSLNQFSFQVPFDSPEGIGWLELDLAEVTDSPFQSALIWPYPVEIRPYAPRWHLVNDYIAALHEDFSASITPENPARANEIIHAYGTGFGAVSPPSETGKPAAANPLSFLSAPLACGLLTRSGLLTRAEVLFAGLAPGWIGLYQVDIRLPATLSPTDYLVCGRAEGQFNDVAGTLPISAAP